MAVSWQSLGLTGRPSSSKPFPLQNVALKDDGLCNTDHSACSLLKDDKLSDAGIHCGDRVFRVYKIIICSQCDWFRAALMGGFEVGSQDVPTF